MKSEETMTGALAVAYNALKGLHRAGQKQGWHDSNYPEEMEAARVALIAIDSSGLLSMRARTLRQELTVAYISSREIGHVKQGHVASVGPQSFERSIPVIIYPQED